MITSLQNPLVKRLRKLRQLKGRKAQLLYLLEGTNLVEAVCAGEYFLETVCCTEEWRGRYPQLWEAATALAERSEVVAPTVLEAIATTVHPDGVIATLSQANLPLAPPKQLSLGLVLERVQDPGNLGTMVRTAVAAGVEGLWLSQDSVELGNPKLLRASVGAWFGLGMGVGEDLAAVVRQYQGQGLRAIATSPTASKTYWEMDWTQPSLILLGNEAAGLSQELLAVADEQVSIPLNSGVESLNVAIATALLLYEAKRQRQGY
ncbi:TrmH family RNA methyltransferase [Spirulina sp. CS-785/01]|uniref:TrmH family RNA methyltransferase n=1 Tax=Spirulina sp. CS-785/01 TaxID=3021716 RepID=UPI003FA74032